MRDLDWIHQTLPLENPTLEEVRNGATGRVFLVQTPEKRYFLKMCTAPFAYEVPLTAALATWFPSDLPQIVAVDESNHCLLMADAGATVRSLSNEDKNLSLWDALLRQYARLQQAALPHREALLRLGVADRRFAKLPALYQQIIQDSALIGHEDGLTEADFARLPAYLPTLEKLCEQAAELAIPETLHHDDFHTNNVGYQHGEYRFFDWCESAIAHPFFSLLMMLRYAKFIFKADTPILDRLRDAYLAEWTTDVPYEKLLEILPVTHQLTALCRALTWWDISHKVAPEFQKEAQEGASYWLLTFLNNTPLD